MRWRESAPAARRTTTAPSDLSVASMRSNSTELPTVGEMVEDIRHLSRLIDGLIADAPALGQEAAVSDASYREAYSKALLEAKADDKRKYTNDEAKAFADLATIDARVKAKVAEAMLEANKQAIQARRTQLSAIQSIAAAMREEAAFTRTRPF